MSFKVPEKFRVKHGEYGSNESYGCNGMFIVKSAKLKSELTVIASDGYGWDHVSVSLKHRCPTWEEMCFIKNMFWDKDDLVIQYHPPETNNVSNHNYCLHLWRSQNKNWVDTPPAWMVGNKELGTLHS